MDVLLAVVCIVLITALLITAIFLRAKNRENPGHTNAIPQTPIHRRFLQFFRKMF